MELSIRLHDSEPQPGHFLTGRVCLRLTAYYPPPAPLSSPASGADGGDEVDEEEQQLYRYAQQLEAERARLQAAYSSSSSSSSSSSPVLQRTDLLHSLRLQVTGKCLADPAKIPRDSLLKAFQPGATSEGGVVLIYRSPAVMLEDFSRPVYLDVWHQPFTCQRVAAERGGRPLRLLVASAAAAHSVVAAAPAAVADDFSVLLPPTLPPSFRGESHRIVYYASVSAWRHSSQVAEVKLPFRVRVSELYYSRYNALHSAPDFRLPAALSTVLHHTRTHPPLQADREGEKETQVQQQQQQQQRVVQLLATLQAESGTGKTRTSSSSAAESTLPSPSRELFAVQTVQRELGQEEAAGGRPHRRVLSVSTSPTFAAAASAPLDPSPRTPPTPPQLEYEAVKAELLQRRRRQLQAEWLSPPRPPSASSTAASSSLLPRFLSAIRRPQSFNISEQSAAASPSSPAPPLLVTRITLERAAFRPGDAVRGAFDFSAAQLPCYRVMAHLVCTETLRTATAASPTRSCRVVRSSHWYCKQALLLPFSLSLPQSDCCGNFDSGLVRCGWSIHFSLVIGSHRQRTGDRQGGGAAGWLWAGWAGGGQQGGEEEEEEDRRRAAARLSSSAAGSIVHQHDGVIGSSGIVTLLLPDPALDVSCLRWELPLDVLPIADGSDALPCHRSVTLEVREAETVALV